MAFTFTPAVRDRVSLLISVAGVSGSGKTLSALLLARGLAGGDDSKIAVIDTEAGRARHYAPAPGQAPGPFTFGFAYAELRAPFTPSAYEEAIKAADDAGYSVIVVDSTSHIWDGEGGVQEMHDEILDREVEAARKMAERYNNSFDEERKRDALSLTAWKAPKAEHKRFVGRMLQTRAHLILALRADERMRIEKVQDGNRTKTVITPAKDLPPAERWVPICEKRLPYEMTVSFLLTPDKPGFPLPLKLQEQHRFAVPLDKPLGEATGRALAEWAGGGAAVAQPAAKAAVAAEGQKEDGHLILAAKAAAGGGKDAFNAYWKTLNADQRAALKPHMDELRQIADDGDHIRSERVQRASDEAKEVSNPPQEQSSGGREAAASMDAPQRDAAVSGPSEEDVSRDEELGRLLADLDHNPRGIDKEDVAQVRAYLRGLDDADNGIGRKIVPPEFKGKVEAVAWGLGHDHRTGV